MGLAQLLEWTNDRHVFRANHIPQREHFYLAFVSIVATVILIGPVFVRNSNRSPGWTQANCSTELATISIQFNAGTYVNVLREKKRFLDWMPDYHQSVFRRNAHSLADTNLIATMEDISPPSALFYTLDYRSNQSVLVVVPIELLPEPGSSLTLCGDWITAKGVEQYHIFYAIETAKNNKLIDH
jgi:hypothetical protein